MFALHSYLKIFLVALLCCFAQWSMAALYTEDVFNYPAGNLSSAAPWSGAGSNLKLIAGDLAYSGLAAPSPAPANSTKAQGLSSSADGKRLFHSVAVGGAATTESIYVSFLLRQTTLAVSSGPLLALSDATAVGSAGNGALVIYLNKSGSLYQIGIKKNGSAVQYPASGAYAVNDTVLVVARYKFNNGGAADDTVTVWINPVLNGIEPAPGTTGIAETTASSTADFSVGLQYVHLRANSSTQSGVNEMDNLRIGSTWADVTPTGTVVPVVAPYVTQTLLSSGGLIMRGTNGAASGVYYLLASTNVAAPQNQWPAIATNQFDANGNFDLTNPISAGTRAQFFRLQVGGVPPVLPTGPTITAEPTNRIVAAGGNASFTVSASSSAPLVYQWYFHPDTTLADASNAVLSLTNVSTNAAGGYFVIVTNSVGSATSAVATLTVTPPPPPTASTITAEPQNQTVTVGQTASFSVTADGSTPLSYQWYFNTNTTLLNQTNAALQLPGVQTNQAGGYSVIITNIAGSVTSVIATLTVNPAPTNTADFSLYGFGLPATGGGQLPETNPNYRKVYNAGDLRLALDDDNTKVIEIMNDLNLGWNEIGAVNQDSPFRQSPAASLHPGLIASGVTTIDIQDRNGLTIFSANGVTIRHAEFNLKRAHNIIIRNLKFDELWEWDELDQGDYDSKDWDFITIGDSGNCTNVWIDHCDFTKSYDGTVDIKGGANNVTISWCRFLGDDGGPNSFVRRQFLHLETNGVAETMFDFLRNNGFSIDDLVVIARSQKKGHLAGPNELNANNADIRLTLHHNYYYNFQDRIPRLRGGNAHVYNAYVNNTDALAAKNLRNSRVAAMSSSEALKLSNGTYSFDVTLNGAISTEDGAVLVEKCHIVDVLNPLRNNQKEGIPPAYTGKIRAEDTIYTLNGSTFRGNTEDAGSPLVPVPAPLKPFSWNGFTSLPYAYPADDPSTIAATITNLAGQGVISWAKTNWFKTTY